MASAFARGLLEAAVFTPEQIGCTCGDDPSGPRLAEELGIIYEPSAAQLMEDAETVLLACKPQQLDSVNPAFTQATAGKLLLSILAGTTIGRLREKFPEARVIVRAMPNTPGAIGAGVTGYAGESSLAEEDARRVQQILGAIGQVVALPEGNLDALTAVSGSGPAYFFEMVAALTLAGQNAGLGEEMAEQLARQTFIGAAKLLENSGENAETLRTNVTSPGGTTEAALNVLQEKDFRGLLDAAVQRAAERSRELAK